MAKIRTVVLCDGETVNGHGFRTNLDGLDAGRFERNPVMLYMHDQDRVIGRWENLRRDGGRLLADAVFDLEDEEAVRIARKVERGFLKGCSMGIRILGAREIAGVVTADRTELMEASIVAVPSDREAVMLYDDSGRRVTLEEALLAASAEGKILKKTGINHNLNVKKMDKRTSTETDVPGVSVATLTALGLSEQPLTAEDLERAVAATLGRRDARIAELQKEIKEMRDRETDVFLTQAVKDGKIGAVERENYRKLADAGHFDSVRALIGSKPERASASLSDMAKRTAPGASRHEGWSYLQWMKDDPKGLRELKETDPEGFERLKGSLANNG
jgi:HK97 family phage prohead protease